MELKRLRAIHIDSEHGTRDNSSIATVNAPARSPEGVEELEALIEEARRRARRRRLGSAAAAALVVVIAGVSVLRLGDGDKASTETAVQPRANGGQGAGRLYLRVVPSERLLSVDVQTGEVTELPIHFNCGDTPFCLIAAGAELVISSVGRTQLLDPAQSGRQETRMVGRGWITVPSQRPGRVWLGILARGDLGGAHTRGLSEVREVDLGGRVIRRMRPPEGRWPLEAVEDGLLFQNRNSLSLWSFAERGFTTRLPGAFPLDAEGDVIASCDDPCARIVVTDVESGEVARLTPPTGYRWIGGDEGAFSPDSSRLAVPITEADRRSYRIDKIAIVDLATGSARIVPRSGDLDRYRGGAMAWSPTGDRLYFVERSDSVISYNPSTDEQTTIARLAQKFRYVTELVAVRSAAEVGPLRPAGAEPRR